METAKTNNGQKIQPGWYKWPTEKIRPNPDQPRKYFDPEKMDGLKRSIKAVGILSPPFVGMPDKNGIVDLLDGERRVRAALELSLEEIPVFIGEADKKDAFLVSVASNFCRAEMSEIEEALAIQRLEQDYHLNVQFIADLMGKSVGWIYNRLKYLKLDPDLAMDLQKGKLSPKLALAVTSYPQNKQKKILQNLQKEEAKKPLTPQQTTRLVSKVSERLGLQPLKTKKGQAPLDFASRLALDITSASNKLSAMLKEFEADVSSEQLCNLKGNILEDLLLELNQLKEKVLQTENSVRNAY